MVVVVHNLRGDNHHRIGGGGGTGSSSTVGVAPQEWYHSAPKHDVVSLTSEFASFAAAAPPPPPPPPPPLPPRICSALGVVGGNLEFGVKPLCCLIDHSAAVEAAFLICLYLGCDYFTKRARY